MNRDESMRRRWKRNWKKKYKSVFEIFLSTTIIVIIIIIIIIINIIVIIIIEKNEYKNCVNHLKNFNILFIYFVEFFASVSSLKKKDWKEVSKFECEENLKKEFACVVYLFVEFFVLENVHFDCEFCDSILIFSLLFMFEFVASSIFSSTLKNLANENQSSVSFFLMRKKKSEIEKKNRFHFLFFCLHLYQFVDRKFIHFYFFRF
jgi:hypothetical protein